MNIAFDDVFLNKDDLSIDDFEMLFEVVREIKIRITLGVVAFNLENREEKISKILKVIEANEDIIEIANHSMHHKVFDRFENTLDYDEQEKYLKSSGTIIATTFNKHSIKYYIPPANLRTRDTDKILKKMNYQEVGETYDIKYGFYQQSSREIRTRMRVFSPVKSSHTLEDINWIAKLRIYKNINYIKKIKKLEIANKLELALHIQNIKGAATNKKKLKWLIETYAAL